MGFRLFVPPGEGQHNLVPKRPDPLGANPTLQYSLLGSTAAAAAYTSLASRYGHRVSPGAALSRPALFIRASAKLGLCTGVLCAAANWYYHTRFASVVVQKNAALKPWKLYERAQSLTVDDGCLAGAGVGLVASIPALFMRRLAIPRWTRCLGLANMGACAGTTVAHGYLQYTGERQKACVRLERRLQRRSLEFWPLFLDRKTMAQFNPLIQLYIRHSALWYSQQLPDPALERAEDDDAGFGQSNANVDDADSTYAHEDQSYYLPPFDYADDLKYINVAATWEKMEDDEAEIAALQKEAEFILFFTAHRQYEYCHLENADDDERRRRLEELQLLQITYNKIRGAAEMLQSRLICWRMSLQHKALLESPTPADSPLAAWLPKTTHDFTTHNPALSIQELERTQAALDAEIKSFEASIAYPGYPQAKRDRWRMDLEDGRSLLRVADRVVWEFEKMQDAARNRSKVDLAKPGSRTSELEKAQVGSASPPALPSESLESGKS